MEFTFASDLLKKEEREFFFELLWLGNIIYTDGLTWYRIQIDDFDKDEFRKLLDRRSTVSSKTETKTVTIKITKDKIADLKLGETTNDEWDELKLSLANFCFNR